mmetsp:Transcript_2059/g.4684  ORF Transcript_2059/g.4684 Transcript_2059/m.4684 type:complete len:269 (-) Transcript_2059:745-1551(-)
MPRQERRRMMTQMFPRSEKYKACSVMRRKMQPCTKRRIRRTRRHRFLLNLTPPRQSLLTHTTSRLRLPLSWRLSWRSTSSRMPRLMVPLSTGHNNTLPCFPRQTACSCKRRGAWCSTLTTARARRARRTMARQRRSSETCWHPRCRSSSSTPSSSNLRLHRRLQHRRLSHRHTNSSKHHPRCEASPRRSRHLLLPLRGAATRDLPHRHRHRRHRHRHLWAERLRASLRWVLTTTRRRAAGTRTATRRRERRACGACLARRWRAADTAA